MLNTSLHNPSVKDKFSVEQFINMVRGIDQGGGSYDVTRGLVNDISGVWVAVLFRLTRIGRFIVDEFVLAYDL